jgi:class 3 adenylate cyclase
MQEWVDALRSQVPVCAECRAALSSGARFCPSCGAAVALNAAAEERKVATVVFADLVGSTELGDGEDPERMRALMGRFYDAVSTEVVEAGGTLEKFIGDALVAAFGAPVALEDHAERALHASLRMQERMRDVFDGALTLRVGVNTGEVVVGDARGGGSFVSGDTVNVAARLEQSAEPGEVLAGERTMALASSAFVFGASRRVAAKGKEHGVVGIPVLSSVARVRRRGLDGGSTVFVGRGLELDVLRAAYARAVERQTPHLVTIVGDAGLGKTRLVQALSETLSPPPRRLSGHCLAYGQGITYVAMGEVVRELYGLAPDDPRELVLERLAGRAPLALSLGMDAPSDVHPLEARERLHQAWVELLTELTRQQPTMLVIEDLHWADDPLLELLALLVRSVEGALLVVGTARPELLEVDPTWAARSRNASQLWLEPLEAGAMHELVAALAGDAASTSVFDEVVVRAEGNPFFAEELVAAVLDSGIAAQLPDTVQAVVAARMDALPPREKAALQVAAVVGRSFPGSAVVALLDDEEPDFELLQARDFLASRHEFKHAVTREVAYASLPKRRRARLHAAFAEWLEQQRGGRDEDASLLAHHYASAVHPEERDLAWHDDTARLAWLIGKAARWLRRAGELAVGRYEPDDGIALLEHAAELETDDAERSAILRELGRANALAFHGPEFSAAMERSLAVATDDEVRAVTYAELAYQMSFRVGMWKRAPDTADVLQWIERAIAGTDPRSAAHCKALIARAFWSTTADLEPAREAVAVAEGLGDPDLLAAAICAESRLTHRAGRYHEALALARRPLAFLDDLDDPEQTLEIYEALVPVQTMLGMFDDARAISKLHTEATRRMTPHHRLHGAAVKAELEELLGDWATIRELSAWIERSVADNAQTPCLRNQRTLLVSALAHRALGDIAQAERLEDKAESLGMAGYDLQMSGPRLRLALMKDDDDALERHLDAGTEAISRDVYWWSIAAGVARLDALVHLGLRERVEELAEPLIATPGTYVEPFALRALARVRGDRALLERARERFTALGLGWHAAQTD